MVIIVGESASGKSSVAKELKRYGYNSIVTYTTRPPRPGEIDGIDYHFITIEDFEGKSSKGFFAETGCYRGWYYGSAKEDYTDTTIAVLTPYGLRQIQKAFGAENVFSVYLNVPRRDRLIKLLERGDDIEEAYRRSLSDVGQFDGIWQEVSFVFKNDGYQYTVSKITDAILNQLFLRKVGQIDE